MAEGRLGRRPGSVVGDRPAQDGPDPGAPHQWVEGPGSLVAAVGRRVLHDQGVVARRALLAVKPTGPPGSWIQTW